MLDVCNVSFSYSENVIFNSFSMSVKKGERVAVLGPSGRGKTTLFHLICGLVAPLEGVILCEGKVACQMQDDYLLPWKTVLENCLIFGGCARRGVELLEQVGLIDVLEKYPGQLSKGMRQRVAFVRALLHESELLLLDEPLSALDAVTKERVYPILEGYSGAIVLVTHDKSEAERLGAREIYV